MGGTKQEGCNDGNLVTRFLHTRLFMAGVCLTFAACSVVTLPYHVTKGVIKTSYYVVKGSYELTAGTGKLVYRIGKFTYRVVKAPLDWHLTHDIDTIDGVSPREAIREGRVRTAPYTVKGKTYYPMGIDEAQTYSETGIASWYGYETSASGQNSMTANGEVFDPEGLTAAHRLLPLPIHVKVTNLENGRSVILRVNDRGPFPSIHNKNSGQRVIDVSSGAAKRLGFHRKGLARVRVEVIGLKEG
jgi:rare lipoprotein A